MLRSLKPGVAARTLLLFAGVAWTGVGIMLFVRGIALLYPEKMYIIICLALMTGILKSHFVLEKSARKNIARIATKEDGACIGGIFSFKSWLLIVLMSSMGRYFRSAGFAPEILGFILLTVGSGLGWASRLFWLEWFKPQK